MPDNREDRSRPGGDVDLTSTGRVERGEMIADGGAGPSGTSFNATGELGGVRQASDGVGRSDIDKDDSAEGDHTRGSGEVIDTNAGGEATTRAQ